MGPRVRHWLKWGVGAPLVPFLAVFIVEFGKSGRLPGLVDVFGRGELLLLSVTLCAAGLGEIIGRQAGRWGNATGLTILIFLATSAFWFGSVTSDIIFDQHAYEGEKARVAAFSPILFVISVILAAICFAFPSEPDPIPQHPRPQGEQPQVPEEAGASEQQTKAEQT